MKYSLDCEFEELKVTKILSSLALGSLWSKIGALQLDVLTARVENEEWCWLCRLFRNRCGSVFLPDSRENCSPPFSGGCICF